MHLCPVCNRRTINVLDDDDDDDDEEYTGGMGRGRVKEGEGWGRERVEEGKAGRDCAVLKIPLKSPGPRPLLTLTD